MAANFCTRKNLSRSDGNAEIWVDLHYKMECK